MRSFDLPAPCVQTINEIRAIKAQEAQAEALAQARAKRDRFWDSLWLVLGMVVCLGTLFML